MSKSQRGSRGFTLIAALLIMIMLSAVAIGLVYMVTNEGKMSANEQQDNVAYYAAESGIEKLTADLSSLYQSSLAPTSAQIQNLTNFPPTSSEVGGSISYTPPPTITYQTNAAGNPVSSWNTVSAGSNQGLFAEIVPLTLTVNATGPTGASVNITRNVEVALIPVFQFGVFCGYDCSYFPGPNFSFGGRIHTNGSLYLASGGDLVFNDKIAAFSQIVLDRLENGHLTSSGYTGTQYASSAAGGCPLATFPPPTGIGTNCAILSQTNPAPDGDASWAGGIPGVSGAANSSFSTASGNFNGYIANSTTGATNLQLPFVQNSCTSNPPPCTDPIQIIRKPVAGESPTSSLGQSRLYNKAQIRILLADTEADLRPGQAGDAFDVQFTTNTGAPSGINVAPAYNSATGGLANGYEYFGQASTSVGGANWAAPLNPASGAAYSWTKWPLLGEITTSPANSAGQGGQGAWIRVEYLNNAGAWVGVTQEWLGYGFGRMYNTTLTSPGSNTINPAAILILQQFRSAAMSVPTDPTNATTNTLNNWYPINFYDAREGEERDTTASGCTVNGVMNAVELDVGNLANWLAHTGNYAAGSGNLVNFTNQNGYLLYFSDRRGMLPDPNQGNKTYGESGLEDVVNSGSAVGTPDGALEARFNYSYSPEDVDLNGILDNWGGKNIGYGFGVNTGVAPYNPYQIIPGSGAACSATAAANAVTGARHVLKLVDGGMSAVPASYLPMRTDTVPKSGGFTVASENPVYVQGNYNSSASDPFWANNASNTALHAAAAIIADSVSVLSNNWSDINSLNNPTNPGNRSAGNAGNDTYYRMAVAGGKNIPFPQPAWGGQDMGTDGGLHNFLRYLESWGNVNLWYNGSLVSMYYSEYNTGIFKCCTTVYGPPTRKYYFDTLFLNPQNLPPGTPEFQDVVNLSYRQNFSPQ
jgi:hypothetical protein